MTVREVGLRAAVVCSDQDIVEDVTHALKASYSDLEIVASKCLRLADVDKIKNHTLDMVIIDLDTKMDTFDVIKSIRSFSDVPIIALSSKEDKNNMLKALHSGADQCIAKPFRQLEFMARVRAMLRINKAGVAKSGQ